MDYRQRNAINLQMKVLPFIKRFCSVTLQFAHALNTDSSFKDSSWLQSWGILLDLVSDGYEKRGTIKIKQHVSKGQYISRAQK